MAEEIAFESRRISNFEGLITLTLDRVILHTIVHHSSTSTYMPDFIEIEETFCEWTDVWTDGWTFDTGTHFLGQFRRVDQKTPCQHRMMFIIASRDAFSGSIWNCSVTISDVNTEFFTTDYRFTETSFLPIIEMSFLFETTDEQAYTKSHVGVTWWTTLRIFRNNVERPIADTKTC